MKPDLENYSFCLFRLPANGKRVLWEITNSCNYSCCYCIFSAEKGRIEGELTTQEAFTAIEGLKKEGFSHIKFTGGEPFARKDFMSILGKSWEEGLTFDVSTNGSLVTRDMARELKQLGISMVHVSVDGHNKEIHEAVRGINTYNPAVRGIRNLAEEGVYVRIGTVIFKANESHLEEMMNSAVSLGADEIRFSFMEPVGRLKGDTSIICARSIDEVKQEIENIASFYKGRIKVNCSFTEKPMQQEKGICPALDKFLYIDNLGRISPCTWVVEQFPRYRTDKTLKDTALGVLLETAPMKSYHNHIIQLETEGVTGCPVRIR